ncbi:MAG TPA: iron ABC transporter permease [Devosiaceae bacterium]|jgi:iron(III) transport system permease protein
MAASLGNPLTEQPAFLRWRPGLYGVVVLALVGGILFVTGFPLLRMLQQALMPNGSFSTELWGRVFSGRGLGEAVMNTAILVVLCNIFCIPIAVTFAWLNERTDARMGVLSTFFPVVPLLLPPSTLAIGWLFLGDTNAGFISAFVRWVMAPLGFSADAVGFSIYSWPGLVFVYILFLVPNSYVIVAAAFRQLDPSLEEAARMSGKNWFQCLFQVAMPAVKPALGSTFLLTTIAAIELYSIAAIIAGPAQIIVLPTYLTRLINGQFPPAIDQAVCIGLMMMLVVATIWVVQRRIAVLGQYARIGGMGVRPNRIALGAMKIPARIIMVIYLLMTSVLPIGALLIVSMQKFWTPHINWSALSIDNLIGALLIPASAAAIRNSMFLGITAATITVLIAGTIAIYANEIGGKRGQWLGLLTKVPSAMSTLVLAIGLLLAFGGAPFFLNGTLYILVIAYVIARMPTAAIAAESSVAQIGNQLVEASRVNGATRGRTFWRVLIPLTLPGMAAGWALIFADIVGDLTAAAILSGPRNMVIGFRIQDIYDSGTYSNLAALAVVVTVFSAVAVGLVMRFARPRFSTGAI